MYSQKTDVTIIRSNRKTVSIEVKPDLTVTLRVPRRITEKEIDQILNEKQSWINKHLEQMQVRNSELEARKQPMLSMDDIKKLAEEALAYIPDRVKHYAPMVGANGISYGRITIRNQKSRWGSCSEKGNLNFNCLLMLTPPDVIDYVVVHELCHRIHMDHSAAFWAAVQKVLPDYKKAKKWLKDNGSSIIGRM